MKKLLIVSHALELGGVERSLIGLLESIDPAVWQVDLFLFRHEGDMMGDIPAHVRLLDETAAYTVLARPMKDTLKEGHVWLTACRVFGKTAAAVYDRFHGYHGSDVALEYSHKYTCRFMPPIAPDTEYDAVISYLTPHYIAARKVRAKKRIAWIHTDYTRIQIHRRSEEAMWGAFDHIVAISDDVGSGFAQTFPKLSKKLIKIENMLPADMIKRQAREAVEWTREGISLLSVGRYCTAKNFDNVPDICSRLLAMGHDVYWYIIGFGPDEELIRQRIKEAGMEERVILLGKKTNPYPYIAACDLYVQPSRFEGKAVTVCEAQMLGKPVAIAAYATSGSQLEDGVDGVIVPQDNEGCAKGLAALLSDPARMERLSHACTQREYSGAEEIDKLYALI